MVVDACVALLSCTGGEADWLRLWDSLLDEDALDDGEAELLRVLDVL